MALLLAFNDLEERKHKNFSGKRYAGTCANIEQKLYGASLSVKKQLYKICFAQIIVFLLI